MANFGVEAAKNIAYNVARSIWSNMHTIMIIPLERIINYPSGDTDNPLNPKGFSGGLDFWSRVTAANMVVSSVKAVSVGMEAAVAELMFLAGLPWYYKFLINPQNFSLSSSKLQNLSESSDLTIINTYRNTSPAMSLTGVSGCTLPRDFMKLVGEDTKLPTETFARYPKLSAAWFKFRQLEKFYNDTNSDIVVVYDMDIYVGKFASFNYRQDSNNPWVINYDMQIRVYPELMLHSTSAYDYAPFFDEMYRRYGSQFSQTFEGK